jgi:hypothetical protein
LVKQTGVDELTMNCLSSKSMRKLQTPNPKLEINPKPQRQSVTAACGFARLPMTIETEIPLAKALRRKENLFLMNLLRLSAFARDEWMGFSGLH